MCDDGPLNKLSSLVNWSVLCFQLRVFSKPCYSQSFSALSYFNVQPASPKSRQRKYYTTGFELGSCAHTHQSDVMTSEKSWLYSQIPWAEFYVSNNTWHCICYSGVRTFWKSCIAWDWESKSLYHLRCAEVKNQTKNKATAQEWVGYLVSLTHDFWIDKNK